MLAIAFIPAPLHSGGDEKCCNVMKVPARTHVAVMLVLLLCNTAKVNVYIGLRTMLVMLKHHFMHVESCCLGFEQCSIFQDSFTNCVHALGK